MAARACEVIGLGAREAKIKQVCSVTTRGGERERETGERDRRREGSRRPAPLSARAIGGELALLLLRAPKNSWKWRMEGEGKKERGSKDRETGRGSKKRRRREGRRRRRRGGRERGRELQFKAISSDSGSHLTVTCGNDDRPCVEVSREGCKQTLLLPFSLSLYHSFIRIKPSHKHHTQSIQTGTSPK